MTKRSSAEQAKLEGAISDLFEHRIRFNEVLGLKLQSMMPPTLRFEMRPELVGHYVYGRLHGGVISAALDATGGMALMVAIGDKHPDESAEQVMHRFAKMGTIDLRIDYLRPAIGERFELKAQVLRLGSRVASTRMEFHGADGELFASGAAAYIVS